MRASRQRKQQQQQHYDNFFPPSSANNNHYQQRSNRQPVPPPPHPPAPVPQYHHRPRKSDPVNHYQYPIWPTSPPPHVDAAPLQPPRDYYESKALASHPPYKSKKWINKILSHSASSEETSYRPKTNPAISEPALFYHKEKLGEDYESSDDEVGLLDLKNRKQKKKKQDLPSLKLSCSPTVIPAISETAKKVVVIDVPSHTTVIIRNVADDENALLDKAAVHHITNMNTIEQLLKKFKHKASPSPEKKPSKSRMLFNDSKVRPMKSELNSTQSSYSVSSSKTVTNTNYSPPQKKSSTFGSGIVKYLSMPSNLSYKQEKAAATVTAANLPEFEYVDSDDSTLEDEVSKDSASEISLTPCSSDYFSVTEEFQKQQQEIDKKASKTKKWIF
ncbi:hypothetical protein A0J61_03420 [Choanephora cucurbitarum]|uniref:Uncharacterized protein n=1 Tax=Choanephora cucurbitarum TaxID=101091 RepID=A0A1C7NHC8_9FUNG|nr:hypothetical protein A0J61_03420 [Choanephora cucurbitarum]